MAGRVRNLLDGILHRRAMRRWERAGREVRTAALFELRRLRRQAGQLRRRLDRVIHEADGRLALPLIGSDTIEKPLHTDWTWRPQPWRGPLRPPGIAAIRLREGIGDSLRVFHDCPLAELSLRQLRNTRTDDLAPFGLVLDVFGFEGSFLSLVLDLPGQALQGLTRRHLLRMGLVAEMEQPLEIFARLNIRHGPNSEQLVRELQFTYGKSEIDFDLAYTSMNEKRLERAWVDLIFESPRMNRIHLRDITFSRRPRAAF